MSFERSFAGMGIGAEPGPNASPADVGHSDAVTPAMRLQILSTEHWSLLASRSLAWNESFSRAGMFLTTLTGAIVALALVAQASAFGEGSRSSPWSSCRSCSSSAWQCTYASDRRTTTRRCASLA